MSTQPLVSTRYRAFDANGNPLAGGLLYTYAAGTTTPQPTYTTNAGAFANANPVVLDADGEADVWLTSGLTYKFVLKDSAGVLQSTVDNYPTTAAASASTDVAATAPGGRLTLTSGTPVTTSDVTSAATLYYAPYSHDKVPIYDGTSWALYSIGTGLSQTTLDTTKSPAAVANNSNYDLFVWNDSGTVRLSRGPAWTSDTARGTGIGTTELQQVNGRYVNKNSITNGPAAQLGLYVGTVRSDGSAQLNDSLAKRHVWNTYSRVKRPMRVTEATASWTCSGGTRQANANAANQLDVVFGLSEDTVTARVQATASSTSLGASGNTTVSIGLDASTGSGAFPAGTIITNIYETTSGYKFSVAALFSDLVGLGRHTLVWVESNVAGTTTFYSSNVAGSNNSGIQGEVLA